MPREDARTKGLRYLTEARLIIERVDGDLVSATCRGSGVIYQCGHLPGRGWHCTCDARGMCSHLHALHAVTIRRQASA